MPADDWKLEAVGERSQLLFARSVELVCEWNCRWRCWTWRCCLTTNMQHCNCSAGPIVMCGHSLPRLSREFKLHVHITDLSRPKEEEEAEHGCGREGCGSDGGCGMVAGQVAAAVPVGQKKQMIVRRISLNYASRWTTGALVCSSAGTRAVYFDPCRLVRQVKQFNG